MDINEPYNMNVTGELYDFSKMHPYSAPLLNPDGSFAYLYDTQDRKPTLNARLANEGYKRTRRNDNNILYGATWKMDFLTPGLAADFQLAYSSSDENYRAVMRTRYPTYHYDSATGLYNINPNGVYDYEQYFVYNSTDKAIKDLNIKASLKYAHVFNNAHDVNVMFLYNRQSTTNEKDAAVPNNFEFFPALAIGYAISQEDFFKNVDWLGRNVQLLKFRTSYGLVGSDVASGDRYLYRQVYKTGDSYTFGEGNNFGVSGIKEGDLGNLNVTWEKARKFNVGVDMNLFDKFSLTFDWFIDKRYDQLVTRNDIPDILGIGLSPENVAETTNKGFDGQIGYQDRFGNFNFNTNFVFGYAKNRVDYKAEAQQKYEWLRETGRQIGQPFGYHWIGYYTPEDIEKINSGPADAPAKPATTLVWTIGGSWKVFSISVLFQGSFDYSFAINGTGIESGKSQFQPLHQKRWTQERYENGESIEFPRLTMQDGTINSASAYNSDFWLINAWYIRLKTVDLGYQLPKTALPKFLDNVRFYVNAYNLLTFTGYDKYQQDPEISTNSAGDAYMNQRVFNFGVQLTF